MLFLKVDVPFGAYLEPDYREFRQTFPIPTPSTVMGMLLSLVGEESFTKHKHSKLNLAIKTLPYKSTVLRTYRRFKVVDINSQQNSRPDFQEVLSLIDMAIALDSRNDKNDLAGRVELALKNPSELVRYGCLCLGESNHLVNNISIVQKKDLISYSWLVENSEGEYRLPIKSVHDAHSDNMWKRFRLNRTLPLLN